MSAADASSEIFMPGLMGGRVVLITGGGTGLGKASALELVRCGAAVTIAGRRADVLEEAAAEIVGEAHGEQAGEVDWVTGDVREPDDAARMIATVFEQRGRLDVLVNNAGGQFYSPAEMIKAKGWRAVWRLNVEGMLNMSEAATELAFRSAGEGAIVNITLSPHNGMPGMAHSGSARATVEALTRELAERWAGECVRTSAIAVGTFETEVTVKYPPSVRAGMSNSVPLQRTGQVAEHAWLVAMLASPLGRALNGSTVTLDGARDNWYGAWPPTELVDEEGEVPLEERR